MAPHLAKRAMQGPTIQGASQRLHATSVMLGVTAVLGRQTAHCVMLETITPRKEAIPHLPAFLVMLETTTLSKEALLVFSVMLGATAVLDKQPAHCVMLETITLRREALPHPPAFLVMLAATTLSKEALPVVPVILAATADLGR